MTGVTSREVATPEINVRFAGRPFEIGYAVGGALRERIHRALKELPRYESFRTQQPWWLPYGWFEYLAERRARRFFEGPLSRSCPDVIQRIAGMASGAAVPIDKLFLFQAFELVTASYQTTESVSSPLACTTIAVGARQSATGKPIVAHNFDCVDLAPPMFVMRAGRAGQVRQMEFTLAPLAGVIDGLNDHGLCITYNYAMARDPGPPAPPVSLAISGALSHCTTVVDAIDWIKNRPRCGAAMLMMADAQGDIARVELTGYNAHVERPLAGRDLLFHTNAFHLPLMRTEEVPRDAVFGPATASCLRGRRVFQSAEARDERLSQLLVGRDRFNIQDLEQLMADHGADDRPSADSICMHGDYWSTRACLLLQPVERRMSVSYSTACQAQFQTFEL